MNEMTKPALMIPEHVPMELVKNIDPRYMPGMEDCPFSQVAKLHDEGPIFWSANDARFGGAWVLTKADDIRHVLGSPELFTAVGQTGFAALLGEEWSLLPLEVDPPQHTDYRRLLNPLVAPPVVAKMEPAIRQRAVDLIEGFKDKGEGEFVELFGRPFPVTIMLEILGLPQEQMGQFLEWEFDLLQSPDMEAKVKAAIGIKNYLEHVRAERQASPGDDIFSKVVTAEMDGRRLTDDETLGILYLFFVGGLDTVASTLGFIYRHLAENPDKQEFLRQNPDRISGAVEEYLRRYSVVSPYRRCVKETTINGVTIKEGDWISLVTSLGSLDPDVFECPLDVDFDRKNVRHFGFSFGAHFCLGNHLARKELNIALEEWLARVPSWRVKSGETVHAHGSTVFGVEHLSLTWS